MRKILIIDDDEVYGELLLQRLEMAGYEVNFQRGPFGGSLLAARKGDVDLVIVDVNMPGLSGTALLDLIRKSEKRVPVILCSSMDKDALRALSLRHGADAFLCKTATQAETLQCVSKVCRSH